MSQNKPTTGPWKLTDLAAVKPNGLTAFSCFHCGGGSTMGYKLAGFNVLGGVEIDPQMMAIYRANHKPLHSYLMGVQDFRKIPDAELPKELFALDVLDGSPPCSSFSMSGDREKKWGEKKKFREGQAEQVLDDLFFDFIAIAEKLRPKVVVAENVRGLVSGKARGYVKEIFAALGAAGYNTQLFLLNGATMGVPQRRERVFFIARRRDLALPPLKLEFSEAPIGVGAAMHGRSAVGRPLNPATAEARLWEKVRPGKMFSSATEGYFNHVKLSELQPSPTVISGGSYFHWNVRARISDECFKIIQAFPDDFDFCKQQAQYVTGMSVPPFMTQRIALQIEAQWLQKPVVARRPASRAQSREPARAVEA